ncbi:flagellar export chaperone FliS [Spongiibacter taiwanensis]|uniref:flagellar export chaperone FliS n=1 Tax=Spongiibacter taiwanensis TaxID=1748242 RepID=UPI002035727D|nr:flagellar export chaperone FliS [Spongiibacter taiwanensis]USA43773.1 flagellar export chaperone FliS [Spongiibacter taiwanensis]
MTYTAGMASRAYSNIGAQTQVTGASPHRLIQLLLDGALDRLAAAKGQMQRNETVNKATTIGKVISIIDGLRMSLDHNVDGEMSENLENLYDYMNRRLLISNINNDVPALEEVAALLRELKEAWDAIPQSQQDVSTVAV